MRLHEEYLERCGVAAPVIRHDNHGSVILRTKSSYVDGNWLIVTFRWCDGGIHPGVYVVDFYTPVHNGFARGKLMKKWTEELEWDEYEDFFLKWPPSLTGAYPAALAADKAAILAAWQVFVYIYDGWFASQSSELRGYVDRALDVDLPLMSRYAGYQNCLIYLTARHPSVLRAWKYEVLVLVQHYSEWLARMVQKYGETPLSTPSQEQPPPASV